MIQDSNKEKKAVTRNDEILVGFVSNITLTYVTDPSNGSVSLLCNCIQCDINKLSSAGTLTRRLYNCLYQIDWIVYCTFCYTSALWNYLDSIITTIIGDIHGKRYAGHDHFLKMTLLGAGKYAKILMVQGIHP